MTDKFLSKLTALTAAVIVNGTMVAGAVYTFDLQMKHQATAAAICGDGHPQGCARPDSYRCGDAAKLQMHP